MTAVVVDADVLIDVLRGREGAVAALAAIGEAGDALWSPTTVRTEILGLMRPTEVVATHALLDLVHWLPVTTELADLAAAHARRYRAAFSGISLGDYLVAAAVDMLSARLLTRNVRHFPMIDGLRPPY